MINSCGLVVVYSFETFNPHCPEAFLVWHVPVDSSESDETTLSPGRPPRQAREFPLASSHNLAVPPDAGNFAGQ
jgi:hypothetical protein